MRLRQPVTVHFWLAPPPHVQIYRRVLLQILAPRHQIMVLERQLGQEGMRFTPSTVWEIPHA